VPGPNEFTITSGDISLPPGIVLKTIKPGQVTVTLDRQIRKRLPVQADWTGRLDPKLIMTSARVEPAFVELVGGSRLLEKMDTVYTQKLSLDDLTESGTVNTELVLEAASLEPAPGFREKVTVEYIIEKRR
jgi:YbbR domain-containing protein